MFKLFSAITGGIGKLWPQIAIVGALLAALGTTGWLLKNAWQSNGELSAQLEQWQAANAAWNAWGNQREAEWESAQLRLQKREADYQRIEGERNDYQQKLRAILSDSPADNCGLRPDIWMLIQDSAAGNPAGSLPGD